jgi:catechol-2,3-dioxygenase
MITHFVELELQTVSLIGVRQVYADRLGLPIMEEDSGSVAFQLTPHTTLKFAERYAPLSPAHFAFQVPYSTFNKSVEVLKQNRLLIAGDLVHWDDGVSIYFRDGDGNILELISKDYLNDHVLAEYHALKVLYLREVGFPVEHVTTFRAWLKAHLGMQSFDDAEDDNFSFVIGGTAHMVVVDKTRPWMNIAMKALPPPMRVTFGTPDLDFLAQIRNRLQVNGELITDQPNQIAFKREGYSLAVRHTPQFSRDLPAQLNLPL